MIYKNFPSLDDPYLIKNGRGGRKDYGGYSPCITGKPEQAPGSVLSNCVGLAWALFAKAENNPDCKVGFVRNSSAPGDAKLWWNNGEPSKWDHYERGLEPREGAVICYNGINGDPYGHVAYVNEIDGDRIVCMSSGYGNKEPYNYRTVKRSEGYKWPTVDYLEFQGFIYPEKQPDPQPDEKPIEPNVSPGAKLMAEEVMTGMYGNQPFRINNIFRAVQTYVNYLCRLRRYNERQDQSL